jgi:hypothetical protein
MLHKSDSQMLIEIKRQLLQRIRLQQVEEQRARHAQQPWPVFNKKTTRTSRRSNHGQAGTMR